MSGSSKQNAWYEWSQLGCFLYQTLLFSSAFLSHSYFCQDPRNEVLKMETILGTAQDTEVPELRNGSITLDNGVVETLYFLIVNLISKKFNKQ